MHVRFAQCVCMRERKRERENVCDKYTYEKGVEMEREKERTEREVRGERGRGKRVDEKANSIVSAQMAIGRQEETPYAPQKTITIIIIINVYDRRTTKLERELREASTTFIIAILPRDISISDASPLAYRSP